MIDRRAGIYCDGTIYPGGKDYLPDCYEDLGNSPFETIVPWSLHVSANGDLSYNDYQIVSDGRYTGNTAWPGLLAGLKSGPRVRIYFSLGSAVGRGHTGDYAHIAALIESQGTGPDSILYRNFAALKRAIPAIDGIDYDIEEDVAVETVVQLSLMLKAIGYDEVSFCPYTDIDFWVTCLQAIEGIAPGLVTRFHLQVYAGGGSNNPKTWITAIQKGMGISYEAAALYVHPGLWCMHGDNCREGDCPEGVQQVFEDWQGSEVGLSGGWIWRYGQIRGCEYDGAGGCAWPVRTENYAGAILGGLGF